MFGKVFWYLELATLVASLLTAGCSTRAPSTAVTEPLQADEVSAVQIKFANGPASSPATYFDAQFFLNGVEPAKAEKAIPLAIVMPGGCHYRLGAVFQHATVGERQLITATYVMDEPEVIQ